MGILSVKDYLNYEELAGYLNNHGENFNIYNDYDDESLKRIIIELMNEEKINPVFYYDGLVKDGFELDNHCLPFCGWIYANKGMVRDLVSNGKIDLNVKDYLKVCKLNSNTEKSSIGKMIKFEMGNYIFMDTHRYKLELPQSDFFGENPIEPKTRSELLFDILDDITKNKRENPELEISLADYEDKLPKTIKNDIWLTFDDLLYPKSDLDKLFNQPTDQTDQQAIIDSQAKKIAELKAKIAELEAGKQSDTPADNLQGLPVFNEKDIYTYPPELDIACKVWSEIYTTENIPRNLDTHNAKYIQALKNLGITFADNAPKERIRIITTPKDKKDKTKK